MLLEHGTDPNWRHSENVMGRPFSIFLERAETDRRHKQSLHTYAEILIDLLDHAGNARWTRPDNTSEGLDYVELVNKIFVGTEYEALRRRFELGDNLFRSRESNPTAAASLANSEPQSQTPEAQSVVSEVPSSASKEQSLVVEAQSPAPSPVAGRTQQSTPSDLKKRSKKWFWCFG